MLTLAILIEAYQLSRSYGSSIPIALFVAICTAISEGQHERERQREGDQG